MNTVLNADQKTFLAFYSSSLPVLVQVSISSDKYQKCLYQVAFVASVGHFMFMLLFQRIARTYTYNYVNMMNRQRYVCVYVHECMYTELESARDDLIDQKPGLNVYFQMCSAFPLLTKSAIDLLVAVCIIFHYALSLLSPTRSWRCLSRLDCYFMIGMLDNGL